MNEQEVKKLRAFVKKIADMKMCKDEPDKCGSGSGPYCDRHGDLYMDDDIEEARALLESLDA
jgi:hypothetical protein